MTQAARARDSPCVRGGARKHVTPLTRDSALLPAPSPPPALGRAPHPPSLSLSQAQEHPGCSIPEEGACTDPAVTCPRATTLPLPHLCTACFRGALRCTQCALLHAVRGTVWDGRRAEAGERVTAPGETLGSLPLPRTTSLCLPFPCSAPLSALPVTGGDPARARLTLPVTLLTLTPPPFSHCRPPRSGSTLLREPCPAASAGRCIIKHKQPHAQDNLYQDFAVQSLVCVGAGRHALSCLPVITEPLQPCTPLP
eukprot:3865360-Rhodomonas_salina.1